MTINKLNSTFFLLLIIQGFALNLFAQKEDIQQSLNKKINDLEKMYLTLHQNPELSLQETQSSKRIADELRAAGLEVFENFGGGVVGILKNGDGPKILVRADMDALPVKEETGLPYSSTKKMKDAAGKEVDVMHACGHDIHMTVFVGVAKTMAELKKNWKGTIIFVGQPAEEIVVGAKAMMDNGLYAKFGRPDYCLGLHVSSSLPAGQIGYCPEYMMANVNSVNITVLGEGGHGAYPHLTKDPVVIASRLVLDLQTIVSREISAIEPAVITVGTIHGGTKRNIVPNEVNLELTIRTYSEATKLAVLEKIKTKAKAAAMSAGLPESKYPVVFITPEESPAVYNNPELTSKTVEFFRQSIGNQNVVKVPPVMVSEDFGRFGDDVTPKIPVFLYWLGSVDPKRIEQFKAENKTLPTLHSSAYYPLPRPTIETGVTTMCSGLMGLMKK